MKRLLVGEISFWQRRIDTISGTRLGGLRAAATNKAKYGEDFYSRIGQKGGQNGHTGGFATVDENGVHMLAITAGRKGGLISRRGAKKFRGA